MAAIHHRLQLLRPSSSQISTTYLLPKCPHRFYPKPPLGKLSATPRLFCSKSDQVPETSKGVAQSSPPSIVGGLLDYLNESWTHFHATGTRRNSTLLLCSTQSLSTESSRVCIKAEEESKGAKRRDALFGIVFAAVSAPSFVSLAFAETNVLQDFRVYLDETNKFKISIPQDWQVGAAEGNAIKSVTAFYPEETFNSNVSVLITGLGADFTRLESFGKVDSFAETLVGGLDRSWQKPPGVSVKLVDSKSANGMYYIDYTLQSPGESRRHIISALGISANGWYNRLYTITGQYLEEEADKYKSSVEKAVSSFRFI